MIINKNSWHYSLVKTFSDFPELINDSCDYIKAVFWSMLFFLVCIFFGAFFAVFIIGIPLATLLAMFDTGVWWFDAAFWIPLLIASFAVIVYCASLYQKYKDTKLAEYYRSCCDENGIYIGPPKSTSFIGQVTDRLKNKYCSEIEFIKD